MTITTTGSITIEIGSAANRREYVLHGVVGETIKVGWQAKDGDAELPLGSLAEIIVSVYTALGGGPEFKDVLDARLDELAAIEPLKPVVDALRNSAVYVTDLGLTATLVDDGNGKKSYKVDNASFGFRVEFSPPLSLVILDLKGFGVLFEYQPAPSGPGVGQLSAAASSV